MGKEGRTSNVEMTEIGSVPNGQYGKPRKHDTRKKGPIEVRSCTDIICCILFAACIIAMVIVGGIAFKSGNPKKLLYPTDSNGNICGAGEFQDRHNLFYFDLLECLPKSLNEVLSVRRNCPTHQICVKDCPSSNTYAKTSEQSKWYCKYRADLNKSIWQLVDDGECAKYTLQSTSLINRCVPTIIGNSLKKFLTNSSLITNGRNLTEKNVEWGTIAQTALVNIQNIGQKVISDVQDTWYWILGGFGITMFVSILYIIIMRWVAGLMVWLTTYLVLTIIGYATYYCYTEYKRLDNIGNSGMTFNTQQVFTTNLSSYKDKKVTWVVLGSICAIVLLVLILLLLALRKRIRIAIQLIKEGSKAITSILSTLFFPLVPWILQLILFSWFVVVLVFLATSSKAQFKEVQNGNFTKICKSVEAGLKILNKTISCNFEQYITDNNILRLQVFHLFGWLWIMNFIIAFGQCVLAGAFASWYWAWNKKTDIPRLPVLSSMGRTLRYHVGSLAFGSLIIAIVQIIRAALEYLEYKLKGTGNEPSAIAKFILKCLKCLFWCLEKFLKFLNENAYIEIAVYGKNFCTSAKNAFFLLMRNVLRVAVIDKVTDFLLFIGKLTVTGGMGVASFYFFNNQKNLNYYLAPVIIIIIAAWMVASAFFSVYEMAINTLFLCFLEDCERHDGSEEKPYYMSKKLRKILGKKNRTSVK